MESYIIGYRIKCARSDNAVFYYRTTGLNVLEVIMESYIIGLTG